MALINLGASLTKKGVLKSDLFDLFWKISMFFNNMQILRGTKISINYANFWLKLTLELR